MDPDSGKLRQQSLTELGLLTIEARDVWMVDKSRELAKRKEELEGGAAPHTGATLADAFESYFQTKGVRLQGSTPASYRRAATIFLEWSSISRVRLADDLRPHHLATFVEWLSAQRAKGPVKGGTRKERAATKRLCGPGGINNRLRSIKAILNHLRRLGRLPHITSDDIQDRLKPLKVSKPRPAFLRAAQINALLRAALRHDAETFELTRDEHAGRRPKNTTPKYDPIAPFIVYMLHTGCRLEEALGIKWTAIDFDARDERGKKAGEIVLRATEVKTAVERVIDLGICPGLATILKAMKLRSGDEPYVFGGAEPWTRSKVEGARRRLIADYGVPEFNWSQREGETPALRATCGSFLTNAPGIYGSASAWHSAKRLGHSTTIAERHYVGLIRGIPKEATTLEAAMDMDEPLTQIVARLTGGTGMTNEQEVGHG